MEPTNFILPTLGLVSVIIINQNVSIHGFTVILPVTLAEGLWSKVAVNRTSDKCGFISVPVVKYGLSWKKNLLLRDAVI